jgi:hypothetical protein
VYVILGRENSVWEIRNGVWEIRNGVWEIRNGAWGNNVLHRKLNKSY